VREAVFNLLIHGKFLKHEEFLRDDNPSILESRKVVDIFCGTGALGIEALSRGAEHVTFVDQDPKILSITRRNIQNLGEDSSASFIRSDSTKLPHAPMKHDLAFVDPPYHSGTAHVALESLQRQGWLKSGAVVVVEHSKREDLKIPAHFHIIDERNYNVTSITLLQFRP
jgi:16S rRNA (guanine966-N2)-methyltransferase